MTTTTHNLQRSLGLGGAVLLGLGSIIGTGVYVSIGIAAGVTGASVLLAVAAAALVATFNGLNSAQLAANHSVSGGTYEYAYRLLNPRWGFTAGWTFLLAKSASAATAALGFASYLLTALDGDAGLRVPLALLALAILTAVALGGVQRSNAFNLGVVALAIGALCLFVVGSLGALDEANFVPFFTADQPLPDFLQATALMFVAYTGYGRIATMGEEVREPRRTIPRAIISALLASMLLYGLVALAAVGAVGAATLADLTAQGRAPLELIARQLGQPALGQVVAIGAIAAMLSVLLNLVLGLSRVLLAMGRRHDMPPLVARLNAANTAPPYAVLGVSLLIGLLILTGNVVATWSFSAFSVLIYYAITNLAALRLQAEQRLFPRWVALLGLGGCAFLAFWVDLPIWILGLALIAAGLAWQQAARRFLFGAP